MPVRPGLVVGLFLLGYIAVGFLSFLGPNFLIDWFLPSPSGYGYDSAYYEKFYAAERIFSWVTLALPIVIFAVYFLLRQKYAKIASMGNPPLPAAPVWTKWFFIVIFFLPLVLALLAVLYFLFAFGGRLF